MQKNEGATLLIGVAAATFSHGNYSGAEKEAEKEKEEANITIKN